MSTENSNVASTPPDTQSQTPAAPSLIQTPPAAEGTPPASEWTEYVPDPNKSDAENAAAKADHDATKPPAQPEAPKVLTAADIKLPEGFEVEEPIMNEFLGVINDPKMTAGERAQKLVDLQVKASEQGLERATRAWETKMTEWQNEVQTDPSIGGPKFQQSVETANRVIRQHGSPELARLCAETGIGNNVHFIKFLTAIAPKLTEGSPVPKGAPAEGPATQDAVAQRMFPSMAPKT